MRAQAGWSDDIGRLGIVGVGLMGGSLALATRREWHHAEVVGYDSSSEALAAGLERGVITQAARSVAEAAAGADLVVISTPVRSIPDLVEQCVVADPPPRLITDMGSTKSTVLRALSAPARACFVGGHPMCGGETAGVRYARANLFEGATYFLCPPPEVPGPLFHFLYGFVARLGARPVVIDPRPHDMIMARISHVPHVLANVLIAEVGEFEYEGRRALHCAGPSFRDLTRVAGANPAMWREVFLENRDALVEALRRVVGQIEEFCTDLERGDEQEVVSAIMQAAGYKKELLEEGDLEPSSLYQITIRIPDEPGLLSRVMTALGNANINIEDLTLHHYSRKVGGDLVLYVNGEQAAVKVADIVSALGYPAVSMLAAEAVD